MTELLREYSDFLEDLRENYRRRGFEILPNSNFKSQLGYEPDLVIRRGDKITVVEIKNSSHISPIGIRELRRRAETEGFDFELKVIPRMPKKSSVKDDTASLPQLLADARRFFRTKKLDLAVFELWRVIEISIRSVSAQAYKDYPMTASGDLIRAAVEFDLISEENLPYFRAIAELRNRVVHGFKTELPRDLVARGLDLANDIALKSGLVPELS
jgi:hypothetical protein